MKAPPPAAEKPVEYDMEFGFNKSRVSLALGRYLDTVVADWKGEPVKFRVLGHADRVGSEGFNQKLSQARADAVKQALVDRGIPASSITATGVGMADPAVPTPAGKRKRANRRVLIMIEGAK
jgi:OOP family OmpA-OmpF porin